ncbi:MULTISPECIES: hypothetical protein [unclassified Streptococcus]|uniref:hypothetical protein n=1 Tax=unclassified Streptococcus TaxID=2608887 RepID=UPI00359CC1F8
MAIQKTLGNQGFSSQNYFSVMLTNLEELYLSRVPLMHHDRVATIFTNSKGWFNHPFVNISMLLFFRQNQDFVEINELNLIFLSKQKDLAILYLYLP